MNEPLTAGEPLAPTTRRRPTASGASCAAVAPRPRRGRIRRFVRGVAGGVLGVGHAGGAAGWRRRLFRVDALQRRSAERRWPAQLPAAGDEPGLCRRRAADGRTRHRAPHLRAVFRRAGRGEAGFRFGRGPEFLDAQGRRSAGDRACRRVRSDAYGPGTPAGRRLDDHAAGRQEHAAGQLRFRSPARRARRSWRCGSSRTCPRSASSNSI